jgi:sugar lactone lactonase YvrE
MAADPAGNVYVADNSLYVIRKITPSGAVSNLAGTPWVRGEVNGSNTTAQFMPFTGIAADANGNVYVSSWARLSATEFANSTIRKITPMGDVTTLAGGPRGFNDGVGTNASFATPNGIAVDTAENVYVADSENYAIRKITPAGVVTTLAGGAKGTTDGIGAQAQFSNPLGLAIDSMGNLYVTDEGTLRKITPAGVVTTQALTGNVGGIGTRGRLTIDAAGNVYVIGIYSHSIVRVSPSGVVTAFAGGDTAGYADGQGKGAQFSSPQDITVDQSGNLYVADAGNNVIRKTTPTGEVTTFAGLAELSGTNDGPGPDARFFQKSIALSPYAGLPVITADSMKNIYVADNGNAIRKITPSGMVTTLPGTQKAYVHGMAMDSKGNLFYTDARFGETNSKPVIRKIDPSGVVTTVLEASDSYDAYTNNMINPFYYIGPIAFDNADNLFMVDGRYIRKITPAGSVSTFVVLPSNIGQTKSMAIDAAGNLYLAQAEVPSMPGHVLLGTYRSMVLKVSASGAVATLAGPAEFVGFADGQGASAKFNQPAGIAVDASGNVYVADAGNHVVRKITPAGTVTTVAGTPTEMGIKLGNLPGSLSEPVGLTMLDSKTLAVTSGVAVVRITLP